MAEFEKIVSHADPDRLRQYIQQLFMGADLPEADAGIVADTLVSASLRGVDSHGVMRVPVYLRRLKIGAVNPRPRPRVVREFGAMAVVDADNSMGQVVGVYAMDLALEMARTHGMAYVGVRGSAHYGMAAYYPMRALRHGMIGMTWTNGPPVLAPFGGKKALMCNNPISFAVPAGEEEPIVVDMAMSVAAGGKVRLAALMGTPIPSHWALAPDGSPTTDARLALKGPLLPLGGDDGGHKGYILGVVGDVLSGVLTGAAFGSSVGGLWDGATGPQNVGHMFMAFNVAGLMPLAEFTARVDTLIRELHSCPPREGVERVLVPGDPERATERQRREEGIPMTAEIDDGLKSAGRPLGLDYGAVARG